MPSATKGAFEKAPLEPQNLSKNYLQNLLRFVSVHAKRYAMRGLLPHKTAIFSKVFRGVETFF